MQVEHAVVPVTMADIQPIIDHAQDARGGEITNVIADLEELEQRAPNLFGRAHEPLSMAKDEPNPESARELLNRALAFIVEDLHRQGGRRRRRTRGRKSRRKTLRKRK